MIIIKKICRLCYARLDIRANELKKTVYLVKMKI